MRTHAEIGPLIEQWMAFELDADARARTDMSWARDHVHHGETVEMAATRMLDGEAMANLERWQEVVAGADWKAAEPAANALIATNRLGIEKGTPEHLFVCRIMSLAYLEVAGVQSDRCLGRWGAPELPYGVRGSTASIGSTPVLVKPSEPLSVLIPKFLDEKKRLGAYQPKRIMDFEAALELFKRFLAEDLPASTVTRKQVGEFRDLLIELPANSRSCSANAASM